MKPKLTEADLINWWLKKYHNTTVEEVFKLHPDWNNDNPDYTSHIFYEAYQVTQEQHDEWREWALEAFRKNFKLSKKLAEKSFAYSYLNAAPMVLKCTKNDE